MLHPWFLAECSVLKAWRQNVSTAVLPREPAKAVLLRLNKVPTCLGPHTEQAVLSMATMSDLWAQGISPSVSAAYSSCTALQALCPTEARSGGDGTHRWRRLSVDYGDGDGRERRELRSRR